MKAGEKQEQENRVNAEITEDKIVNAYVWTDGCNAGIIQGGYSTVQEQFPVLFWISSHRLKDKINK